MTELKTFKSQFIKGFSWRLCAKLISFVGTLYLGRYLSASDFGEMVFIFNLLTFAPALSSLGLYEVLMRKKDVGNAQVSSVLNLILIVNFFAYLLFIVLIYSDLFQVSNKKVWLLTILSLPLSSIQTYYNHQFFLKNTSMKLATYQSYGGIIGIIAAMVIAYIGFTEWALAAQLIIYTSVVLICSIMSCKILPLFTLDIFFIKDNAKEAVGYLQSMLIKNLMVRVDRLTISYFFSKEIVGLYDFASKFAFNLFLIIQANLVLTFRTYFFQIYHAENKSKDTRDSELRVVIKRISLHMIKFIIPAFLGLGFLAKDYLRIFYGNKWEGGEIFIMYLSVAALIRIFTEFYQTWLSYLGHVNLNISTMRNSLGISILLLPFLHYNQTYSILFLVLVLPQLFEHLKSMIHFYKLIKLPKPWEILFYILILAFVFTGRIAYPLPVAAIAIALILAFLGHYLFCRFLEQKSKIEV